MELYSKQICRTCITEVLENEMLHFIYDTGTNNEATTIADLLMSSIPKMQIKLNDELPKIVCLQCLEKLLKMAEFQKMCLQSQFELLVMRATVETSKRTDVTENILNLQEHGVSDREESDEKNNIKKQNTEELIKIQSDAQNDGSCVESMRNVNSQHLSDDMEEFVALETVKLSWESFLEDQTYDNTMDQGGRECIMLQIKEKEESPEKSKHCAKESSFSRGENSLGPMENAYTSHSLENTEFVMSFKAENESIQDRMEVFVEAPNKKSKDQLESEHTKSSWSNREPFGEEIEDSQKFDISVKGSDTNSNKYVHKETPEFELPTAGIGQNHEPRIDLATSKYVCKCCTKGFKSKRSLSVHEWHYNNQKSTAKLYTCPICLKVFTTSIGLSGHKRTHSDKKKYVCDMCGAAFKKSCNLTAHKRIHSKERPYKCNYCDMRFKQAYNMKRHEQNHTREESHKCKFCLYAFVHRKELDEHLRKFLGENIYRCELCPQRFCSAKNWRDHFVSHKNEDEAKRFENLAALKEEEPKLMEEHRRRIVKINQIKDK